MRRIKASIIGVALVAPMWFPAILEARSSWGQH